MIKILLFPIALLYDGVTRLRNYLYDRNLKPSIKFDLPVIAVGNLTVGGTGKTPMVEYLIRLMASEYRVGTLSRGYGRKTKGFRMASAADDASTIGDEPMQYFSKFSPDLAVAVGEERALAIPRMLHEREDLDVVLLDDAFQHRRVRPSFNILLCDYHRPFYDDLVLPAGRLREAASGAARADAIVVTKCPPHLGDDEAMEIQRQLGRFSAKPAFFCTISYGNPVSVGRGEKQISNDILLVTGLANAAPLEEYVRKHFNLVQHLSFRDHHNYSHADIQRIAGIAASKNLSVLTTEKDKVKMDIPAYQTEIGELPFFYLPITVQFLNDTAGFDEMILSHVRTMLEKKNTETNS